MNEIFLGIDIAGASNTWVCGLSLQADRLVIQLPPEKKALAGIVQYAEDNHVLAAAIDAPITSAVSDENGFRSSDRQLRGLLPPKFRLWVASQNSLMAVPLRGRQLAEALAPTVGTIIETHPRACLYFAYPEEKEALQRYKDTGGELHRRTLWNRWRERFSIAGDLPETSDGALDAAVCATIALLFHRQPHQLIKLKHNAPFKTGIGPFYVLKPEFFKL